MKGEVVDWKPSARDAGPAPPDYSWAPKLAEIRAAREREHQRAHARWLEELEQWNRVPDQVYMEVIPPDAPGPEDLAAIEAERAQERNRTIDAGVADWWRWAGPAWVSGPGRPIQGEPSAAVLQDVERAYSQMLALINPALTAAGLEILDRDQLVAELERRDRGLLRIEPEHEGPVVDWRPA